MKRFEFSPTERDERLGEAVEAYMALAEAGNPPEPEDFAELYPELKEELIEALDGLSLMRGLVGEPGRPGRLEKGRRLAGYRIVRELGSGGMGVVYEAVHVDLDRPVALKVLDARATPDSSSRRRFEEEAKLAAALHHTHIVPVFDVGQVGGLYYYAMQKIDGCGLDRILRTLRRDRSTAAGSGSGRRTPAPPSAAMADFHAVSETATWGSSSRADRSLSRRLVAPDDGAPPFEAPRGSAYFRWVAEIGRQAAQALAFAHRRGVIHRDIKPSNLLVEERGAVWVTDFGLARRLADPSLTQADSLLGTPRYMSPEQARPGPIDGRADIFSLGATLYELLTLRPPFDGRSAAELVQQIATVEPIAPRKIDPRIPRDLETITLKALAKRPDDRFTTAADLAEDLARFLAHEPVRARRIGPLGRVWRFARRHPALTAVSTTAAAVVLATGTIAYVRVAAARDRAVALGIDKDEALKKLARANRETQHAMREQLLSSAEVVRNSSVPERRQKGLELLGRAVALGPDAGQRARLRDQAIEFLSLRDVQAKGEVPTGPTGRGLAFGPAGKGLATLSEDGKKFTLWDVAKREPRGKPADTAPSGHMGEARTDGRSAAPGRPGPYQQPRLAAIGPLVAVLWPDGQGIRLFDGCTGTVEGDLPTIPDHESFALYGADSANGLRLVTVEGIPQRRGDGPRPGGPPPSGPTGIFIHLWDPDRPLEPIATLSEPTRDAEPLRNPFSIPMIAFSPDGEVIATARSREQTVNLWSAKAGQARGGAINTHTAISAIALGPDNLLAAAGGGTVRLWDTSDDQAVSLPSVTPHQGYVWSLRFSPDGSMLAAAGGTDVELWDPANNTLIAGLPAADFVRDVTFSPGGRSVAVGQSSGVAVWAIVEPIGLHRLTELEGPPASLAFDGEGNLAIAAFNAPLRLIGQTVCPTKVRIKEGLKALFVSFDPAGRLAVIGVSDPPGRPAGTGVIDPAGRPTPPPSLPDLRVFDRPDDAEPALRVTPNVGTEPRGGGRSSGGRPVSATPDGRAILAIRHAQVLIWRADDPKAFRTVVLPPSGDAEPRRRNPPGPRSGPSWQTGVLGPKVDRLYLINSLSRFSAWSLTADGVARPLDWRLPAFEMSSLAISPDGTVLALGDRSGGVTLVDATAGSVRGRLDPPEADESLVRVLAFAPDGRTLAIGSSSGRVRLAHLKADGRPDPASGTSRLPGHRGPVWSLAFDRTGDRLATGGEDRTVDIWDLRLLQRELDRLKVDR